MEAARLRLRPPGGSFPGVDAALAKTDGIHREGLVHLEWLGDGTYVLVYRLRSDDPGAVESVLAEHEAVIDFDLIESGSDHCYSFVHVHEVELLSGLLAIAEDNALVLDRSIEFVEDGVTLTVAGEANALQQAYERVVDSIDVTVEWSGGYSPDGNDVLARLTTRQREAIRTAYELGFYENPRGTTYEEIASELDCAPSTANELLRRAERTAIRSILDG